MANGLPISKTLIKLNRKKLKENDEEEKVPIDIEFTEQNTSPENNKNAINFIWSSIQEEDEKDIA